MGNYWCYYFCYEVVSPKQLHPKSMSLEVFTFLRLHNWYMQNSLLWRDAALYATHCVVCLLCWEEDAQRCAPHSSCCFLPHDTVYISSIKMKGDE